MKVIVTGEDGVPIGQQIAALPYRTEPQLQVMLITSRETGRWVIPKGWPMKGRTDAEAAAQEAWEEAGLKGRIEAEPAGAYHYDKVRKEGPLRCRVAIHPLLAVAQAQSWPEQGQRETRWFTPGEAALLVAEPELADFLTKFTPKP